jgi:hypothetical protein
MGQRGEIGGDLREPSPGAFACSCTAAGAGAPPKRGRPMAKKMFQDALPIYASLAAFDPV